MRLRNIIKSLPYLILALPLIASDCEDFGRGLPSVAANAQRSPVWSSDGTQILFNHENSIYVVETDGSRILSITDSSPDDPFDGDFSPSVSPNGTRVAFATSRHSGSDNLEIGTSDLDGSSYRRLTDHKALDTNPVWSPDGTRIAFVSDRMAYESKEDDIYAGQYGVYTMAGDGSNVGMVSPPSLRTTKDPPVWSPDSRRIAFFVEEVSSTNVLYAVGVDGSDPRRVSKTTAQPTWSPDGTRIAFVIGEIEGTKIYTARPDGSDVQEVTVADQDPDWSEFLPEGALSSGFSFLSDVSWSPDGLEVRIFGQRHSLTWEGSETRVGGVHAIKVDGSGSRTIAIVPNLHRLLMTWSPDGSRIAFQVNKDRTHPDPVLYTIAGDGSDERGLVWISESGQLVTENPAGQEVTKTATPTPKPTAPAPRPEGQLAYEINECSKGIVVPDPEANPGLVQDCETLLSIQEILAGDPSILNWRASNLSIAEWVGVRLGGDPIRVQTLFLTETISTIPGELGKLTGLEGLNLGGALTGSIPPELRNLSNLRVLILNGGLTGEIPPELGRLSNLEQLYLQGNSLRGSIPTELGSLTNLRALDLRGNDITGCIPAGLANNSNLRVIATDGLEPCR